MNKGPGLRATLQRVLSTSLIAAMLWGCGKQDAREVKLQHRTVLHPYSSAATVKPLRLCMGAMITPKEGYLYYHELKRYLEGKLGRPVQLVDRDTYGEVVKLIAKGDVDASFLCAGPYVEVHDRFGLEPLAVPQVNGRPFYYAYIIVSKDSPIRDFTELRGKTFAFIDPKSNTGKLVPTYMLARFSETPERFFRKVSYAYGHDRATRAVAEKMVDGAAVSSNVWEYLAKKNPDLIARTRIIARSEQCGAPPFVVSRTLDAPTKRQLLKTLLSMHEDPRGKRILADMMIDRFVSGTDRDHEYDQIRKMQSFVAQWQGSRHHD